MTCEAFIWKQGESAVCGQSSGLRQWWDASGVVHTACRYHAAERMHRYPAFDPPEPDWFAGMEPEYADSMTFAKWEMERAESWTMAEDGSVSVALDMTRTEA